MRYGRPITLKNADLFRKAFNRAKKESHDI